MAEDNSQVLAEIMEMLKDIKLEQQKLLAEIRELRAEQNRLYEEIKITNYVISTAAVRKEMLN